MNILIVTREIPPVGGGAGYAALYLAKHLIAHGHRIDIITMGFGNLPALEERQQMTIHRVDCKRRNQDSSELMEMLRFVRKARSLARSLARHQTWDVVHAYAIIPDGLAAVHMARSVGARFIITSQGSDTPGYNPDKFAITLKLMRPVWHHVLGRAHSVTTPSSYLADMIRAHRPGQSVEVIPNGLELVALPEIPRDESFLILSRLVRRKNFHLFLQALQHIKESQTVHIVGDGPMRPTLEALAQEIPQHDVRFHGWLENGSEPWRRLLATSRYFIFPSTNESFGIAPLEAQAAGLIVLASDFPVHREVLGDDAVYLSDLSIDGLVTTVRQLLRGELTDTLDQDRARRRIAAEFSWDAIALRFIELYQSRDHETTPRKDAS